MECLPQSTVKIIEWAAISIAAFPPTAPAAPFALAISNIASAGSNYLSGNNTQTIIDTGFSTVGNGLSVLGGVPLGDLALGVQKEIVSQAN